MDFPWVMAENLKIIIPFSNFISFIDLPRASKSMTVSSNPIGIGGV